MTFWLSDLARYWTAINGVIALITVAALIDAIRDHHAIRRLDGTLAHIAANGNVRRELMRLLTQALLLAYGWSVVQGPDRQIALTFPLLCLLMVPVPILANTAGDWRDRKRLERVDRSEREQARRRDRRRTDPK